MAGKFMYSFVAPFALLSLASAAIFSSSALASDHSESSSEMRFVQIAASNKDQRSAIANEGVSIEATRSDSVWGFATLKEIQAVKAKGYKIIGNFDFEIGRGGHENFDFPSGDSRFHNYAELTSELQTLQTENPDLVRVHSIGKSLEGRDIWAIHINTNEADLEARSSARPGAIYMGNHHAREHLSLEIPLMLAQHLVNNRRSPEISALLDSRDIWIIPMVNPDGAEYDISTGRYKMWRKNRRDNGKGKFGVDLNRNYSFGWGTGGSSKDPSSDVFMGPAPFSEPETQAIRDFVSSHLNAKVLLTFHTFSELILYPWGGKNDPIADTRDRAVFEKMATTMAGWNNYTPEPASDLYIASGDTVDWAYGTHKIFAFTFELSPKDMWDGGFYPGQSVIDRVFNDNLKPCLYMLDAADNPYKLLGNEPTGFLRNYVEPQTSFFTVPQARSGF